MRRKKTDLELLKESFKAGRLIPFVGAGFSMVDPALPGWIGFLQKLRMALSPKDQAIFDKLGKLEKAEFVRSRKGDSIIEMTTRNTLKRHPKKPSSLEAHKILVSHFDRIYTTNYDRYFETVAKALSIQVHTIPPVTSISPAALAAYIERNKTSHRVECPRTKGKLTSCGNGKPTACRVVKYHGDYRVTKSLVLTETSYFQRLLDVDAKDILFSADALHFDFLFMGYGFDDLSLKFTLQQLERTFETLGNTSKRGDFYILRTTDRPQDRFQDAAYNLITIDISRWIVPQPLCHSATKSCLRVFHQNGSLPTCTCGAKNVFDDFSVVWNAAEDSGHTLHKAAIKFRAHILSVGFTNFLNDLVS